MNYKSATEYLFSQLPMFQRVGKKAFKKNLDNIIALCDYLGNPQNQFKSIHIAGTNGKGSTTHALASVLVEQGYKTGLYTSPHYKDFRERIKIGNQFISETAVVEFVETHRDYFNKLKPSFFEITVAMAFWYFAKSKVDIAVIETGLGGRLDSTNVITPLLSVITNIGLDHTNFLGDTLPLIAGEKAGIIKPNVPVVIGAFQLETASVFLDKANKMNSLLYYANQNEAIDNEIATDLRGPFQQNNLRTAKKAVEVLQSISHRKKRETGLEISDKALENGFKNVVKNTNMMGRWQILDTSPLTIADSAHNAHGLSTVLDELKQLSTTYKNIHIVLGMVKDKDVDAALALFPQKAIYYFCKADIPRGLDADLLAEKATQFDLVGKAYSSVKEAFVAAKQAASVTMNDKDLVFVVGSVFVVAEVL